MRRRARIDAPALVGLTAIVVLVGVALALLAQRDHYFFLDEHLAIYGGRAVDTDGFPHGLLEAGPYGGRGPERLTGWLVGLVGALSSGTAATLRNAKVVLPVVWALVALPTWALARVAGLSPRQALLPAVLVVASAWSLFGLTLLNTTLGLLTLTVALWVTARVAVRPGWRWELGVLAAFALVALARVGNLPFAAVVAPAILAGAWDGRPADVGRGAWALRLPLRLGRTWPILTAVVVAGIVVFIAVGQERLLGSGYGAGISRVEVKPGPLLDVSGVVIGRTALAMGVVPVVLAGWWLLGALAPARERAHRVVGGIGLGVVLVAVYVLYTAQIEDRYLLPLLPIAAVAGSVALLRSRPSAVGLGGVALVALGVAWAIWYHGRYVGPPLFDTFFATGTRFVEVALGGRADRSLGISAARVIDAAAIVGVVVAVAALAVRGPLAARRPRAAQLVSVGLAAVLALFGVAGAGWATTRFTRDVGTPNETWAQVAWIDSAVASNAHVGLLVDDDAARDPLVSADLQDRYLRLSARNAAVRSSVGVDGRTTFPCCEPDAGPRTMLTTDQRTGRVTVDGPRPQLLAVTQGFRTYGFNTTQVAAGDQGFTLERATKPLALGWISLDGPDDATPDGWSLPGRTLQRRTFPANAPNQPGKATCWSATLSAPIIDGPLPVRITGGTEAVTTSLGEGAIARVEAPLPTTARPVTIRIRADRTGKLVTGQDVGVRATDDRVGPCAA